jgi:parallel beta-helix repeat protein
MNRTARVVALCTLAQLAGAEMLFVAPSGKAEWSGRLAEPNPPGNDGPLPSLDAARDKIRALRKAGSSGPFTVRVRGGVYWLASTFVLQPEDSGTAQGPLVFEAYPGERPILSGGRRVRGWKKGAGNLWTAPLAGATRQLFISGRRAQRARTPNNGYLRIMGPSSEDKLFRLPYDRDLIRKTWENGQVEIVALLGWTNFRRPILRVDESRRLATLAGDAGGSEVGIVKDVDGRFYLENALEALDSPGEWYLDPRAGIISYWPAPGENLEREEVVAAILPRLVRLDGDPGAGRFVRHVVFRNLEFRHADWTFASDGFADNPQAAVHVGAAFEADGAEDCTVESCTFTQLGGYALWFRGGAKRNRLAHNHVYDAGAGGIKLGETALRAPEAERSFANEITDNEIHHLGAVYPAAVGVWVGQSSRNSISHNRIHDVVYSGISTGWVWGYGATQCTGNRIEFNEIYNIGMHTLNDLGGIYTLGTQDGVIRNNVVHDVTSFAERGRGIYLDEGSTRMLVENNIVYRCKSSGFHLHYGKENIIRNNIFARNAEYQISRARAESFPALLLEHNIIYADSGRMVGGAWTPGQIGLNGNLYYDARAQEPRFGTRSFSEWRAALGDGASAIADPQFADPGRYDFRLRPESPAFKTGFRPIDVSTVGPRTIPAQPTRR